MFSSSVSICLQDILQLSFTSRVLTVLVVTGLVCRNMAHLNGTEITKPTEFSVFFLEYLEECLLEHVDICFHFYLLR